jgi:hypothetical protein
MSNDLFDSEPEDAWDADDSIAEQVDNLRRRVLLLVASARAGRWTPRDELRATDIDIDLKFILQRLLGD